MISSSYYHFMYVCAIKVLYNLCTIEERERERKKKTTSLLDTTK